MTLWQRARRPAQKAERRRAILDAAAALLDRKGFDATSMSAIACRARLSKGNLYRYFCSKEELFLQLYRDELVAWVDRVVAALDAESGPLDPRDVADLLARSVAGAPRLAMMVSLLSGVLEKNVGEAALAAFKGGLREPLDRLVCALAAALPGLTVERAVLMVHLMHSLVAGLWPASNPSPRLKRALARPELRAFEHDFQRDLTAGLRALVLGMLKLESERP